MSKQNQNNGDKARAAATEQMTFGEIARYLQGGFDPPVQRAIATNVQYSNLSQQAVANVKAVQAVGKNLLLTNIAQDEGDADQEVVDVALMAAYLDGALSPEEEADVLQQIGSSHAAYHHFTEARKEIAVPVQPRLQAPEKALALVKVDVPQVAPAPQAEPFAAVRILWSRFQEWVDQVIPAPQWQMPAAALAMAAVAFLVLTLPGGQTVVSLQDVLHGDDRVVFSVPEGQENVSVIPADAEQTLVFVWSPQPAPVKRYQVDIYQGETVVQSLSTAETELSMATGFFVPGTRYTLVLSAEREVQDGSFQTIAFLARDLERAP